MNAKRLVAIALLLSLLPSAALAGGFRGGGGGFRGGGGGGFRGGGGGRPSGGFDFHGEQPQSFSHSSTGPAGTQRTTTATQSGNGYARQTTATNGSATRTSYGAAGSGGNYTHGSTTSTPYGSKTSNTTGNVNSGNYTHSGSGSNQYGAYSTYGTGNGHTGTYSGSTTGVNSYGQVYHSNTYAGGGTVYHGAVVANPVYGGYPSWGWNGGYPWYPAPNYWGGGFWGGFAVGATTAVVLGSIVNANQTYTSYQAQPNSAGAKLLESYHLTQVPCGPSGLVVIYGPNNSVICATPNSTVAAGSYSLNTQTLTITSQNP